jgi:hypothetical protein
VLLQLVAFLFLLNAANYPGNLVGPLHVNMLLFFL